MTGCPLPLRLVGYTLGSFESENELHCVFEYWRTRAEWFRAMPENETIVLGLLDQDAANG